MRSQTINSFKALALGLSLVVSVSCSTAVEEEQSSPQDLGCVGNYLGQFIEAIPLPGFSLLGKIGAKVASGISGVFKSNAVGQSKGTCSTPATFSDAQMEQMKSAIKDGFNEQNHMEAKALMNKIDVKLRDFVEDEDRYTDYTMTGLQLILEDVLTWWSQYDQSGARIHNVTDFVLVTGLGLKAYQHQVRQVAIEAANNRTAGDANKVRKYAEILASKADHIRKELEEISTKDVEGVATGFWKNKGASQTKKFYGDGFAHCYESASGDPYNDITDPAEAGDLRTERYLQGMRATKTIKELSDYASKNGTVCCMDGFCENGNIEKRIKLYQTETTKQIKKVMFEQDTAMMQYYNETLPLFINAGKMLQNATDADIFQLAATTEHSPSSKPAETNTSTNSGNAANAKPTCKMNEGKGFGDAFDCGSGLQCRKDDGEKYSDSSICVTNAK